MQSERRQKLEGKLTYETLKKKGVLHRMLRRHALNTEGKETPAKFVVSKIKE